MVYVKQTWIDGVAGATPISAARLAHIEDGIGEAVDLTSDQTLDANSLKTFGGLIHKGPREYYLRGYGAQVGVGNINTALPNAIADVAESGGVLYIEPTGNSQYTYSLSTSIILPKKDGYKISGHETGQCRILANSNLPIGVPMFTWEAVNGHVNQQTIENLYLNRATDGPVIYFEPTNIADPNLQDRWKGTLRNLRCASPGGGTASVVHLKQVLKGKIEDLWVNGGLRGLHLEGGSHASVYGLYSYLKDSAPTLIFCDGGGNHSFYSPRGEGSPLNEPVYKLVGTKGCSFYDPHSETRNGDPIWEVTDSEDINIHNPGLATSIETTSANPRCMKFNGSKNVKVFGGHGPRLSSTHATGKTIEITSTCAAIQIIGMTIEGTSPMGDVIDAGLESELKFYSANSTPSHPVVTPTPLWARGVKSRGGTAQFGSVDNTTVEIIQNNTIRASLNSTGLSLTSGIALKAISGTGADIYAGTANPEGSQVASVGSLYLRTGTPGEQETIYFKESGSGTNTGWVSRRTPVVLTANLPAAAAAQDGRVIIEDAGAGDRNLVFYAGGQRFRVDGGTAF